MIRFSLRRLMAKKDVSSVVSGLNNSIHFCIQDIDGTVLGGGAPAADDAERQPVKVENEVVGWVSGGKDAHVIVSLLEYLAGNELEKKTLALETLDKYKEINLLYSIGEKISASLDLGEATRLVAEEAGKLTGAPCVNIMLFDNNSGNLDVIASSGDSRGATMKPGEGISGSVFLSGRAEIVNDVKSDPRYIAGSGNVNSMVCSPLKINDRVIGVIDANSDMPVIFKAEHLKLLNTLASQTAAAIENARLYGELKSSFFTTVGTLAETIEKRDPYTAGHTNRVMDYSLYIGMEMGLEEDTITNLMLAAMLHDIGKIGVRDNVLLKEGKLTDEEFGQIKMHPVFGEEILMHVDMMKNVIPGVRHHHERYDGRGYPDGLRGKEIHIIARIIAVADTYDAMTSDRPYRKGLAPETAFAELRKNSGTQFDPDAVDAFFAVRDKKKL